MDQIERGITRFAGIFRDKNLRPVKRDEYVDNLLSTRKVSLFDFMGKHEPIGGYKKDKKKAFVYLFYGQIGDGLDVIYVGKSNFVRERINKHKISSKFWPDVLGVQYIHVSADEVDEIEQGIIKALSPPCNKLSNPNYDRTTGMYLED